ncbi:hypothetical protein Mal64_21280 [Pseudobythopirellula maris]|uniref:Uncharacterized protein n=1 Tax=Pseudobythopirellula maris TaxID=2527991 RepID=A0A5C5ZPD4_9BACT|nr:hypothetical protein [Pseudobythopirellula maris]TWT88641.1 hypothetical protein Mal64_21280 [Pseudobythopirellula maris]
MVAARKVKCLVVTLPVADGSAEVVAHAGASGQVETATRVRPSDLLPWADPYIRGLVSKLQDEVREEHAAEAKAARAQRRFDLAAGSSQQTATQKKELMLTGANDAYGWGI